MSDANLTKKALASSLKKLMKTKPFEKISVIDICEGCGMNRKSFYYHFKDKYDLVNWIFYTDFITTAARRSYVDGWDLLTAVVELFSNDRDFYKSALEITGQNSFRDYFYESTMPIFSLFVHDIGAEGEDGGEEQLNTHYLSDSFLVIMYRWLNEGQDQTPEACIDNLKRMIVRIAEGIRRNSGKKAD